MSVLGDTGADLYLSHSAGVESDPGFDTGVSDLRKAFRDVHVIPYTGANCGYPGGSRDLFVTAMRESSKSGSPCLWLELDCVPVTYGWMEDIRGAVNYATSIGKKFVGPFVPTGGAHMNGTGVYPPDWEEITTIASCPSNQPFDCWSGKTIVPLLHDPGMIQHGPINVSFDEKWKLRVIRPDCRIFHPNKCLSLIACLNEYRFGGLLTDEIAKPPAMYFYCESANNPGIKKSGLNVMYLSTTSGGNLAGLVVADTPVKRGAAMRYRTSAGLQAIGKEEFDLLSGKLRAV